MDVKKMIAIVQIYIHNRTNKEVNINIESPRDLLLLHKAYNIANKWLNYNNSEITRLV